MGVPNRQIGWSQESNLLWYILSQLKRLSSVIFSLKPKYKVFTALLTQNGGDDPNDLNTGSLTIGVTYKIIDTSQGMDFTNVGAPNNDVGTYFIATGEIPNSWGENEGLISILQYNIGAPVATVLENTIGNIWFTYNATGIYPIISDGLFPLDKTTTIMETPYGKANEPSFYTFSIEDDNEISINTLYINFGVPKYDYLDGLLDNTFIEIRVYN